MYLLVDGVVEGVLAVLVPVVALAFKVCAARYVWSVLHCFAFLKLNYSILIFLPVYCDIKFNRAIFIGPDGNSDIEFPQLK